jgi:NAD-dependent deacetylase
MTDQIQRMAQEMAKRGRNVFFTGAGISTESGIPDYRSKGGIWDQFRPVYFDEFMSSKEARIEYWRQKEELYEDLMKAKPNAGHAALFRLYEMGLLEAVITQNIDGLHQASGLPDDRIIELHGNNTRVRCMSCGQVSGLREAHERVHQGDLAPECACGGYLKPDTISFGQAMPVEEVRKAADLSQHCNFFCVIGSTLLVQPAAQMPYYAKNSGAFLAIINLSDTPCDSICDALVREKAGNALQELIRRLEELKGISV